MPYIGVGTENSGAIELYYEDHGAGPSDLAVAWLEEELALPPVKGSKITESPRTGDQGAGLILSARSRPAG